MCQSSPGVRRTADKTSFGQTSEVKEGEKKTERNASIDI